MTITLTQTTPGCAHLHTAIAYDAPGSKFIRVQHVCNGALTVHSTEILYGGDGLILAGDAEAQLAPIIETLDTALQRGTAMLEIITDHVAACHPPTIQRYYSYGGRHLADSDFNQEMFGHAPQLLAVAERTRQASYAASLQHVQHVIDEREQERARVAARIAQEMKTRAFWIRRHREHLARARGCRRAGEHRWHAYALNAAAHARAQAAATPA